MLTTNDWLSRAASDPSSSDSSLSSAESAARYPDDLVAIAGAWLASGNSAETRRCISLALDRAAGEHWPTRRAAELLLGKLGDRAAAAAALGRIAAHRPLESMLVWLSEVADADSDSLPWPLFGLVLTRARRSPSDPHLSPLVASLLAAEAAVYRSGPSTRWLFRPTNFDSSHDLWRHLAAAALSRIPAAAAPLLELSQLLT